MTTIQCACCADETAVQICQPCADAGCMSETGAKCRAGYWDERARNSAIGLQRAMLAAPDDPVWRSGDVWRDGPTVHPNPYTAVEARADGSFDIDRVAYDPEDPSAALSEVEHCADVDAVLASLEVEL